MAKCCDALCAKHWSSGKQPVSLADMIMGDLSGGARRGRRIEGDKLLTEAVDMVLVDDC